MLPPNVLAFVLALEFELSEDWWLHIQAGKGLCFWSRVCVEAIGTGIYSLEEFLQAKWQICGHQKVHPGQFEFEI